MLSQMAIEDMDDMIDEGLRLRPSDVVRLNALGLRAQYARESPDFSLLPRVAILPGDHPLAFREPTVGHELWMRSIEPAFDLSKAVTFITVRAFCLAHDQAALPDLADVAACQKAVADFQRTDLAPFTLDQIAAALFYAENGNSAVVGEHPARRPSKDEQADDIQPDERCYEMGVLYQGVMLGLGSPNELKGLTVSALNAMVRERLRRDERFGVQFKEIQTDAMADYLRTKDAITERLKDAKRPQEADENASE